MKFEGGDLTATSSNLCNRIESLTGFSKVVVCSRSISSTMERGHVRVAAVAVVIVVVVAWVVERKMSAVRGK